MGKQIKSKLNQDGMAFHHHIHLQIKLFLYQTSIEFCAVGRRTTRNLVLQCTPNYSFNLATVGETRLAYDLTAKYKGLQPSTKTTHQTT